MAISIDLTTKEDGAVPVDGINKHYLMKKTVDFTLAANQLATTLIMALFEVAPKQLIEEVFMVVDTIDADITTVDLGVATLADVTISENGFMEDLSLAVAGLIRDLAGETYSPQDGTVGYYTAAGCKIILTNQDAQTINEAKVTFFAKCLDLS